MTKLSYRALLLLLVTFGVQAFELKIQQAAPGVYALVGDLGQRSAENHALNATMGFVVTPQGVILIDSGASHQGAALIAAAIRQVTAQPLRWVINSGQQDHRWLGNSYFAERGAELIALERTVAAQQAYGAGRLAFLRPILGERLDNTQAMTAPQPLPGDHQRLELGGVALELIYPGAGHFPDDVAIWLPESKVLFSGDLVFVERMLGILPASDLESWRRAFGLIERLQPRRIVPGHGPVCDLAQAKRDTADYLDWLAAEVRAAQRDWQPIDEVVERLADAPAFRHLANYEQLHRQNIHRTYLYYEQQESE